MEFTTGYSRGYIRVTDRGIEREMSIDFCLKQDKRSNDYKAAKKFLDAGSTKMTVRGYQHPNSPAYCYFVYEGYK